jgi:hypothetical protein
VRTIPVVLLTLALVAACGGDDDGGGEPATQTPFFAPSPYTTEVALQKLDEAELLIKLPDPELVNRFGIGQADLQQRITLALKGTSDTTGLDDARAALEQENRILAAEYIHNVVFDYLTPAFGGDDSDSISEEQLDEIDPWGTFVDDHSQGMFTTAIFKDAVIKLIELWYRVLPS